MVPAIPALAASWIALPATAPAVAARPGRQSDALAVPDTLSCTLPTAPAPVPPPHAFDRHLADAVSQNRQRREIYAAMSGGRTRSLSNKLIMAETLSRPIAALIDRQAEPFNRQGFPVVTGDFVSMDRVRPAEAPPTYRGQASPEQFQVLHTALTAYRHTLSRALHQDDLVAVGAASDELLNRIEAGERSAGSHFAMTKHIVESIGMAALNGEHCAEASGGRTLALSERLIRVQELALLSSLAIDREAQAFHLQGIGIVVNDVPAIPFREQWEAATCQAP